jgi:hypothetical protein
VLYDSFFQVYYPFRYPIEREIEHAGYVAHYQVAVSSEQGAGKRPVVYADQVDDKVEAEERLQYIGGPFSYSQYDVSTFTDRALLTLQKIADGDLHRAVIYGRPIVLDLNRSCFMRDTAGVNTFGTVALNVTGSYFSEYEIDGKPQYEDWVIRELTERVQNRREFTLKTHRGLFNARVGARVKVEVRNEQVAGVITALSFRYRKNEAFVSTFRILAES